MLYICHDLFVSQTTGILSGSATFCLLISLTAVVWSLQWFPKSWGNLCLFLPSDNQTFAGKAPIPSGKRLHNYGKSPFLLGKSTINGPFSIAMLVYRRVTSKHLWIYICTIMYLCTYVPTYVMHIMSCHDPSHFIGIPVYTSFRYTPTCHFKLVRLYSPSNIQCFSVKPFFANVFNQNLTGKKRENRHWVRHGFCCSSSQSHFLGASWLKSIMIRNSRC